MGFGMELLFHLVFVFVLSLAIALVGSLIVFFVRSKRKGRLYLFAFHAPFLVCYTFYFLYIVASMYIGQQYGVDEGLGDTWYVPLIGDSRLMIVDLPQNASILKEGRDIVYGVDMLYQNDSLVLGKTDENSYFAFNGDTLVYISESIAVSELNQGQVIPWTAADAFYREKKEAIAGNAYTLAMILCTVVCLMVVLVLKRIVLGKAKRRP